MENQQHSPSRELRSGLSEREIQHGILMAFGARPWLRIWRCNTGKAFGFSLVAAARALLLKGNIQAGLEALKHMPLTTYGQPGAADIQGIIGPAPHCDKPAGRFLAIEVKQPGKVQTDEQRRWMAMVVAMGGLYILATSVEDVKNQLWAEGYPA